MLHRRLLAALLLAASPLLAAPAWADSPSGGSVVSQDGLASALRQLLRDGGQGSVLVALGSEVARAIEKEAASDGLQVAVRTAAPAGDRAAELRRVRGAARCLIIVEAAGPRTYRLGLDCAEPEAATPSASAAITERQPFSFTKVIFRLDPGQVLGQAWFEGTQREVHWASDLAASTGSTEVRALERLRAAGLPARGAEDLLFGQDRSSEATLMLGGEVRDVHVSAAGTMFRRSHRVSLAVDWQVFDRRSQEVIARLTLHGMAEAEALDGSLLDQALLASVSALASDPRFLSALVPRDAPAAPVRFDGPLLVPACVAPARTLPLDLPAALQAVLPVTVDDGLGAGVLISPEGWVLTAAHVIEGATQVTVAVGPGGLRLPAQVVRVQPAADVALLQIPGSGHPCLPVATGPTPVGTPVYAVGAPMGQDLGISVTQGIVSGTRAAPDGALLQTDASLSPGHSGGPLLGPDGRVLAILSFKFVAEGVEGMGFGVSVADALRALEVEVRE